MEQKRQPEILVNGNNKKYLILIMIIIIRKITPPPPPKTILLVIIIIGGEFFIGANVSSIQSQAPMMRQIIITVGEFLGDETTNVMYKEVFLQ